MIVSLEMVDMAIFCCVCIDWIVFVIVFVCVVYMIGVIFYRVVVKCINDVKYEGWMNVDCWV